MTDEDCPQCGSWHRVGFGCPVDPTVGAKPEVTEDEGPVCAWCKEPGPLPLRCYAEAFCSPECEVEWILRNEPWDREPPPRIGDES